MKFACLAMEQIYRIGNPKYLANAVAGALKPEG